MKDKNEIQFLIYNTQDEDIKVKALVNNETLWLTQRAMSELFATTADNIGLHLKNVYAEQELDEVATTENFSVVQKEGERDVNRTIKFYNLDAIIAVGYRVNSKRATAFRQWATKILKEYMQKGFVIDDYRLKQGETAFGKDYFRELLERVRSIRASERRIWQQITDIFAECAIDYNFNTDEAKDFFATIQNKFHYAITGQTAAEIIYTSADSKKDYMGLTTWKNSPDGRVLKSDVTIAKNYLSEKDIKRLEREVSAFFDYVERLIEQEQAFNMNEFSKSVNEFLEFRKFDILVGHGKISKEDAEIKAEKEYSIYNKKQLIESDFDKLIKATRKKRK